MKPFVKAKRIWNGLRDEPNQYALFKDSFELPDVSCGATLRIRVENRYSVTVNGEWIPAQQYSDYLFYPVYDEIELPPGLLRKGKNELEILAYCQNESSFIYRKGEPSLIYELESDGQTVAYSSEKTLVTAEVGFRSRAVELLTKQLLYSFVYDGGTEGKASFKTATELPDSGFEYIKRPIPQLTVSDPIPAEIIAQGVFTDAGRTTSGESVYYDFLSPRNFSEIGGGERTLPSDDGAQLRCDDGDGIYAMIDLKGESSGYLVFDVEVSEACRIVVGYGEHLEDLRVRSSVNGRNFAFTVNAVKGRNKVFWPIKRLGGRYFQMHAKCHDLKIYYIGMRSVDYPFGEMRVPQGLNTVQRKIYDVALNTLRLCSHEHYEDTPWREQGLYAMDSRNEMLFAYCAFGETLLTKESLRLMALGQKPYGLLELCSPAEAPDRVNIPCFSLVWICSLKDHFDRTGELEFVKEMLPSAKRILEFFSKYTAKSGLVRTPEGYWNFYEWSPMLTGSAKAAVREDAEPIYEAPLNAFYIMALRAYAELCRAVGEENTYVYSQISAIEAAYEEVFYSVERGAYRLSDEGERREVYPELVQSLSIVAELCKDSKRRRDIVERLIAGEFSPAVTLSHRIYFYQAILVEPDMKEAVLSDIEKHWLPMLFSGATSFWETELGAADFKGAGSLCHGWSAAPIWVYWQIFGN